MKLYLVQHGKAQSEEEDPRRPLSGEGEEETKKVASFISRHPLNINRIYHSPKLRARQTARILAAQLSSAAQVEEREGLAPKDAPQILKSALDAESEDLMLVGHLPHLSRLASLLLCGEADREIVNFTNSGVLCLEKRGECWFINWIVIPQFLD